MFQQGLTLSNSPVNQLLISIVEALFAIILLLALFRMRLRLGLTPLYITLGVFQPIQMLLASSIYAEISPGLVISPGSTILFTASLFAVLIVYIREDAIEARKVIYGIIAANMALTLLMLIFGAQLELPNTLNFLDLPQEMFSQGARVMATGTIALFADVLLIIFVYEAMGRLIPGIPFLRIYLTMVIILTFDTLIFATSTFYGQPDFNAIFKAAIVGKAGFALLHTIVLTLYLRFMEPSEHTKLTVAHPFRDIFYALTYREKYELEREELRLSEEKFSKVFNPVLTQLSSARWQTAVTSKSTKTS